MTHELFFEKRIFNKGLNMAIRLESKWRHTRIGDDLVLKQEKSGKEFCTIKVAAIASDFPFIVLSDYFFRMMSDPDCHSAKGATSMLKRQYPKFSVTCLVHMIFFGM